MNANVPTRGRHGLVPWVFCLGLFIIGLLGWLRPTPDPEPVEEELTSSADIDEIRQQVVAAGFAERVKIINRMGRLGRLGGAGATRSLVDTLRGARTHRVRRATIKQLGLLGTPGAVSELAAYVTGGPRQLQHHAIRALGEAGSPKAVARLLEMLDDGSILFDNRDSVLRALGDAGGERAVASLIKLAGDARERERDMAIDALGATGDAAALPVLKGLLSDDVGDVRTAAVEAMGELGTLAAQKEVLRLTRSSSQDLRLAAVEALDNFTSPAVLERLARLMQDRDPKVAKEALEAMADKEGATARKALMDALAGPSAELRAEAADALASRGDPAGVPALIKQLHGQRHTFWVANQLANSSVPAARKALLAAAGGQGTAARAAVSALGDIKGKAVDRALTRALHRGAPEVATEALEQLVKRRGAASLPMLLKVLRGGSNDLRGAAMSAVAELGIPSTRPMLLDAARSPDRTSAGAAVKGLIKIGGQELPSTLLQIVKSGSGYARGEALEALAVMGGPRAREALIKGLTSRDFHVGYAAKSGLAKVKDPALDRRLQQMLSDPKVSAEARERIVEVWSDREDRAALLKAARHTDAKVSAGAMEALGACGGADGTRLLASIASGGSTPERRIAAVKGLAKMRTPDAVRSLGQALYQPRLLKDATEALAGIGSQEAIRALSDRYVGADRKQRLIIIEQLGNEPNPWTRGLLDSAMQSGDQELSLAAGKVLARQLGVDDTSGLSLPASLSSPGPDKLGKEMLAVRARLKWAEKAMRDLAALKRTIR